MLIALYTIDHNRLFMVSATSYGNKIYALAQFETEPK